MENTLQLSNTEIKMLSEISKIFKKYKNKTRQFGIQLCHSHFSINSDEILYETHDKVSRTLLTRTVQKNSIVSALATTWEINNRGEIKVTSLCCDTATDAPIR